MKQMQMIGKFGSLGGMMKVRSGCGHIELHTRDGIWCGSGVQHEGVVLRLVHNRCCRGR
jgi:hypothetical protein